MSDLVWRYNFRWSKFEHPISVEATMIRRGGRWKKDNGTYAGNGLAFHFKQFISLVWPDHVWHRWNEIELDAYLNYRIIGELGPASSGKTHSAAIFNLADYYVWHDCTTVLVSSTEREMLEMRIWGEMKKLHKEAKEKFPLLIPGNLIESRQRIVSSMGASFAEGRDFRNGICFPGETMVDTPTGPRRIDSIQVGDAVYNATGVGTVADKFRHTSRELLRVHLSDGRTVDCTPEHPFLTQRGWISGIDLETFDTVFSSNEAMQILREGNSEQHHVLLHEMSPVQSVPVLRKTDRPWIPKQEILQCSLPRAIPIVQMLDVRGNIPAVEPKAAMVWQVKRPLLHSRMCWSMGGPSQTYQEGNQALPPLREVDGGGSFQHPFLLSVLSQAFRMDSMSPMRPRVPFGGRQTETTKKPILRDEVQTQGNWTKKLSAQCKTNSRRTDCVEVLPKFGCTLSHQYWPHNQAQSPALVSNRHRISTNKTGSGNRWRRSQDSEENPQGQATRCYPEGTRVDYVEVLKQASDPRCEYGRGVYQVYNLSVTGHPSYSVNSVLVHNCGVPVKKGGNYQGLGSFAGIKNRRVRMVADELHLCPRVFIDAISNLNKNADFKCIGLGNPKDTTDALGILCEPAAHLGGWDGGIDQGPKTKTWPTRFTNGICVQLVGSDSPNLDGKMGIPIIEQKAIDADIAFYGKDSLQFTMMNEGRMPRGQGLRRVITRQMCLKFGAMEEAIWKDDNRTKIAFLDAAYGSVGGDRCVFGELQFGMDPNDKQILAIIETMLVPVSVEVDEIPEDQIANFCKSQCDQRGIPPQNFGFDSTGRGSLMGSFGRIWSPHVVGIEFGGRPSERPVTWIPSSQKVLCCDYYSKFVSELWYSVRLTIESRQFRGMTEDVMTEGAMREWGLVSGNKVEVEPKDKMKIKTGRSPDLFDALVSGVEMARRHGFIISMVVAKEATQKDDTWRNHYRDRMRRLEDNHRLTYS